MNGLNNALIAYLQHMLPGDHWDVASAWNPMKFPAPNAQYLSTAYWNMLDATVTSRQHWNPVSLDLSFGHSLSDYQPGNMVQFYNEMQQLSTVTTLRIRQLFHSVHLWHNLPPHWLTLRHLSLEFRTPCPQVFFTHLGHMEQLEVLQLEFLVSPQNLIQLDLTTSLVTLSIGLPFVIQDGGLSLDQVELGVMPFLQELILYAPTLVRTLKKTLAPFQTSQIGHVSPAWLYTLDQFTSLKKLEWHYISYTDFCALGPYLPPSLTNLKLTRHSDNDAQDIAHYYRIYFEQQPRIDDNFPNNFDMEPMVGSLLKLPRLTTANLPEFVWKYHSFTEMLPQMTFMLGLDVRNCPSDTKQMANMLSGMRHLTCLRMLSGSSNVPTNIAFQDWLSTLYPLNTAIWPALEYVKLDWTQQDSHSKSPQWTPLMTFLQLHSTLLDLTLTVSYQIAADDQFWSVLSEMTLLTALECMIKPYNNRDTLKVPILPPALKRLVWEGCTLMIPYDHLALENVKLVADRRDSREREDANEIRVFCRRNRVRNNRTLRDYLDPLDTDALVRHWFD